MTKPITIEFDDAQLVELERIARESGTSVEELVRDAIVSFAENIQVQDLPPLTEEDRAKIEAGLAAVERGDTIPHDEVAARLRAKHGG